MPLQRPDPGSTGPDGDLQDQSPVDGGSLGASWRPTLDASLPSSRATSSDPDAHFEPDEFWACRHCGSGDYSWDESILEWRCPCCGSSEFSSRPLGPGADGAWFFVPSGLLSSESNPLVAPGPWRRSLVDPFMDLVADLMTPDLDNPIYLLVLGSRYNLAGGEGDDVEDQVIHQVTHQAIRQAAHEVTHLTNQTIQNILYQVCHEVHSWNSVKGPMQGVKFRGGQPPLPPAWHYDRSDLAAFRKWRKRVEMWSLQVVNYVPKKEAGILLFNSLKGELEEELEDADVERIYDANGVGFIVNTIQKAVETRTVHLKRQLLSTYEHIYRNANESMRAFTNRYQRTERSLATINIKDVLLFQWPDHKPLPPALTPHDRGKGVSRPPPQHFLNKSKGKGKGKPQTKQAFVTEANEAEDEGPEIEDDGVDDTADYQDENEHEDEEPPEQEDGDDENWEDPEVQQILSVTARKLAGVLQARKYGNSSTSSSAPRRSIADRKRTTHCSACGQQGHWAGDPECSVSNKGKSAKGTGKSDNKGGKNPKVHLLDATKAAGHIILDTACQIVLIFGTPINERFTMNAVKGTSVSSFHTRYHIKLKSRRKPLRLSRGGALLRMHLDRPPPPPWLWRWRYLVKKVVGWARQAHRFLRLPQRSEETPLAAAKTKAKAMKAKFKPETTYLATTDCEHQHVKRSGNRHGSYAQCLDCKIKWKWNPTLRGWEHFIAASSSSQLPPPSLGTVLDQSWTGSPTGYKNTSDQLPLPPSTRATRATTSTRSSARTSGPLPKAKAGQRQQSVWDLVQDHQRRHGPASRPTPVQDTSHLDLEELLESDLARWEEAELGADDPRLPPGWNPEWDVMIDQTQEPPVLEVSEDDYDWENYGDSLAS
ncbi:unnamed protein product [Durusdinium trenchii]|uniref:Uncharacterized protein n=1 Tax=Durusdinium trenchii TaxID=1381693 RepID=A0ABP0HEF7_9DINO